MGRTGPTARRRRELFDASLLRRPMGTAGSRRAPADPETRRLSALRRLHSSPQVDPIDRSLRLVGPIHPYGVAALSQPG